MNLLLFKASQLQNNRLMLTNNYQHQHIRKVLKAQVGDSIRVGEINGCTGYGVIIYQSATDTQLQVDLLSPPPAPLALKLLLALPRPKMLRRILHTCANLGVAEIKFIHTSKVDKSYWQTPHLQPDTLQHHLQLGLEQGGLTHMPKVTMERLFKPFIEDSLHQWAGSDRRLLAHPLREQSGPNPPYTTACAPSTQATTLILGPEGGLSDYEVEKIIAQGFTCTSLGDRILRVETAIPVAIAQWMQLSFSPHTQQKSPS